MNRSKHLIQNRGLSLPVTAILPTLAGCALKRNDLLNYTDPSGFFFKGLFKAVGNFFSNVFSLIGQVLKAALRNPIVREVNSARETRTNRSYGTPLTWSMAGNGLVDDKTNALTTA